MQAVRETQLQGLQLYNRGKVRDVYDLDDHLLIVATDRISAFDVVMPNGIPDKGKILTALSVFWFHLLEGIVPNHFVSADVGDYPAKAQAHRELLEGRSMLVRKAKPFPVECVIRGYLAGSGWKEYQQSGTICGIPLPAGLRQADRLPEPIYTPATKAQSGHDENISFEQVEQIVGKETAQRLRSLSLALYNRAAEHALSRGMILADTKFEFGLSQGEIMLIDEVLTPDSSRFWLVREHQPGKAQNAFDKQYLRDYLETLDWDKRPPAPVLPEEVVEGTRSKYIEAYELITGKRWNG